MGMPSGDSPQKAQEYYHYLQAHQQTTQRAATWHVRLDRSRLALGLRRSCSSLGPAAVGLAVPLDPSEGEHLPGGQLRRLHDRARRPGDGLLPDPDRGPHRLRGRADRRATSSGGRSSDGTALLRLRSSRTSSWSTRARVVPAERVGARLRLAAGAQGTRPGIPGLPEASTSSSAPSRTATAACTATRPGTRPSSSRRSSSAATRSSGCSPTSSACEVERSLVMEKMF